MEKYVQFKSKGTEVVGDEIFGNGFVITFCTRKPEIFKNKQPIDFKPNGFTWRYGQWGLEIVGEYKGRAIVGHLPHFYASELADSFRNDSAVYLSSESVENLLEGTSFGAVIEGVELKELNRMKSELELSREETKVLKEEIDHLRDAFQTLLSEIFDINEGGGHGSRKKVREMLLASSTVSICEKCGKAVCTCDND